jgi:hypothetical protein
MSKPTPGPWEIYVDENGTPVAIYGGDNRGTICDFRIRDDREHLKADANVMAASKELLEALKSTLGMMDEASYRETVEGRNTILATIAKAEGET